MQTLPLPSIPNSPKPTKRQVNEHAYHRSLCFISYRDAG